MNVEDILFKLGHLSWINDQHKKEVEKLGEEYAGLKMDVSRHLRNLLVRDPAIFASVITDLPYSKTVVMMERPNMKFSYDDEGRVNEEIPEDYKVISLRLPRYLPQSAVLSMVEESNYLVLSDYVASSTVKGLSDPSVTVEIAFPFTEEIAGGVVIDIGILIMRLWGVMD